MCHLVLSSPRQWISEAMFKTSSTPLMNRTGSAFVVTRLLGFMVVVLIAFLAIGLNLVVLPLHVHQDLGLSTFVVGLVSGSQFGAALLSRVWAGTYSDTRGAKRAVIAGLLGAGSAGLVYVLSLAFARSPVASVSVLLVGRAILGASESFIITGALAGGLGAAGPRQTGKVMAWIGTAMYAAFTLGAPLGTMLYESAGFVAIALATIALPLVSLLIVAPMHAVTASVAQRPSVAKVITAVWVPGVGLALSSAGFGAVMVFVALLFAARGWTLAWLPITAFAAAFILARVLLGHLADRLGGAKVALVSVLIEATGLAIIWRAPTASVAVIGAVLTGLGYSLIYPAFGLEAVRRAPAGSQGLATGAYTSFLDLALGIASPLMGLLGAHAGLDTVFLASALCVLGAAVVALRLLRPPQRRIFDESASPSGVRVPGSCATFHASSSDRT